MIEITIKTDDFRPIQFDITHDQMVTGVRRLFTEKQLTNHTVDISPDNAIMRVIICELFSLKGLE